MEDLSLSICSQYTGSIHVTFRAEKNWNKSFTNIEHREEDERFGELNPRPNPRIFSSISVDSLILTHFRFGPHKCSHCTKVWHRTYRRLHVSVYTWGKKTCSNWVQTCHVLPPNIRSLEYAAVVDLIRLRSTKYSLQEFSDVKNNFWRQVCCFWASNMPAS